MLAGSRAINRLAHTAQPSSTDRRGQEAKQSVQARQATHLIQKRPGQVSAENNPASVVFSDDSSPIRSPAWSETWAYHGCKQAKLLARNSHALRTSY